MTSVLNADSTGGSLFCYDEVSCNIGYRRKYTPIIHEVVPNQIYKEHKIDWWVNIQDVHSSSVTPKGRMPFEELSIDGSLNNWEGIIDGSTRLDSYQIDSMSVISGDQRPNKNSVPRARFISGDSLIRNSARHCNFAGDDCWNVRTHARIDSVSANEGSTQGG